MGLVIGYLAVQSGHLVPCILFHAIHNTLAVSVGQMGERAVASAPDGLVARLLGGETPLVYHPASVAVCGACAAAILWRLHYVPYRRTAEEQLEEARQQQDRSLVGA